jgi:glycosyltransferase involved in cell wall biosynthesis
MTADVSIVLVTYNRASFLRKTLDSILTQTYPHFELLICDDCSTDDTEAVCQEYADKDRRIVYSKNRGNLGMPGNLNAGLRNCKYEFIADLHDGDIYAPTLIEKWRDALIKHPSAGFVFNRYRHLVPDGTCAWVTPSFPELLSGTEFLDLCFADNRGCPVWGTVMGRRSIYERLGWFDGRYRFWADIDMWFRIAESCDVAHVPELLIDLPAREKMPRLFAKGIGGSLVGNATVFRIYWRAKCRHFRRRPFVLAFHLARQTVGYWSVRVFRRLAQRLQAT